MADAAPLERLVSQQDLALSCALQMRLKASEYRQLGFKFLAKAYLAQATAAERWAVKIVRSSVG